uniref:Uncharacterized protein n=1 Tax=Strigops habroptila TaxID=2489341 RepID=A0A672UII0_STRHB
MEGQRLPGAVNPNHFPGKLWLLVNSPRCGSVRWDARGQGAPFPILHKCSTEVTYTLQTVFSLLPLQRRAPTGAASLPQGSSCASPGQCSRAPDPTGMAKVLHLLLKKLLTSDTGNVFFQCLSPCEDKMMEELSLEAMLQILDKRLSPPNTEIVTLEPVESEISQPLLVNSGNSDSPSAVEGRQLAPLTPAAADTSFLMEAAQALTSAEGYDGELLFVPYDIASVERAAAAPAMAPEPVATQEAPEEWRKQLDHCPAQPPEMFVLEGLFMEQKHHLAGWLFSFFFFPYRVLPHAHGSGAGQEMVACKTHLEQQQRAPKSKQHRLVLEFF